MENKGGADPADSREDTTMRKEKPRPLTKDELSEAKELCRRSRAGDSRVGDHERCSELFRLDPEGYGECSDAGRREADRAMNPMLN